MGGPFDKVSPTALDLARRLGLDPSKTFGPRTDYIGLDGLRYPDAQSVLEANQRFEENFNHVTGGNCGQDPSKARG